MIPQRAFEVQGHRGARGLKPENTLVGFEVALDLGVSALETDLHLTADDVPILYHDPQVQPRLCSLRAGANAPDPAVQPLVRSLTLGQLRGYRVEHNPDAARFPRQDTVATPLARQYAAERDLDPLGIPTLSDLFAFTADYAGAPGRRAGKTPAQQERAARVRFDLELKRVPFHPQTIGDGFDGASAGRLECAVLDTARRAGVLERVGVRSFDHRSVRTLKDLEPSLQTAIIVAHTAPVAPVNLANEARAEMYCPDYHFLDEAQVHRLHEGGKRVIPWTVNHPDEWDRLCTWGVDGITTDVPDELICWLGARGLPVL
jgi:glycerophosphoryl diester phosphodiesterase